MKLKNKPEGSRKKGNRKVNPIIVVVCEGKETEVDYFEGFNSRYMRVDVRVANKNSRGKNKAKATDPESLVKKANNIKNNDFDINKKDGDRVWCVFDVDINYNNSNAVQSKIDEIQKAKKISDKNEIKLGISNPCFELWYLLHYEYTTANLKNYDDVKKRLNKYINSYEKNISIYSELKQYVDNAIKNGKKLKKYHEDLGAKLPNIEKDNYKAVVKDLVESNPYTNIGDLIEYMESLRKIDS